MLKGSHHTKETKKLISDAKVGNKCALGHIVTKEARDLISVRTKEGMNNPETHSKLSLSASTRPRTPESNLKRSITMQGRSPWCKGLRGIKTSSKGQKAWNKGLTKEMDERVLKYSQNCSQTKKENWLKLTPQEKSDFVRKWRRATNKRPNLAEQLLDNILQNNFPNKWEYVGNGKLVINGLIPDFANINGKKTLIELFGDYWHRNDNPQDRIDKFAELGYPCLVIWSSKLENPFQIVKQITNFIEEVE